MYNHMLLRRGEQRGEAPKTCPGSFLSLSHRSKIAMSYPPRDDTNGGDEAAFGDRTTTQVAPIGGWLLRNIFIIFINIKLIIIYITLEGFSNTK